MVWKIQLTVRSIGLIIGCILALCPIAAAQSYSLSDTIREALAANLEIKASREATRAALATRKASRTTFFPTFSAAYQYQRNDESSSIGGFSMSSKELYVLNTGFSQPIFTGFALLSQYRIDGLNLDVAELSEKLVRQDVILTAKQVYFNVLKAQKLLKVAEDTVANLTAQKEVARDFHEVGMTPLNDLLEAQVALANARQAMVVAKNDLAIAEANFNVVLRRPVNSAVIVDDILDYKPFGPGIDYCLKTARANRLEVRASELEVSIAEREVKLSQSGYYPTVTVDGDYFRRGTNWDVDGGSGIYDPDGWTVTALASWDFWEWGRTAYGVSEKRSRMMQAIYRRDQLLDTIELQVKEAFLKTREAETNITTVEKAIEQARENLRINEERYKEQVATTNDVLDAQVLLSRTMTNYFSALYDFKLSKAALYRAMGQEDIK